MQRINTHNDVERESARLCHVSPSYAAVHGTILMSNHLLSSLDLMRHLFTIYSIQCNAIITIIILLRHIYGRRRIWKWSFHRTLWARKEGERYSSLKEVLLVCRARLEAFLNRASLGAVKMDRILFWEAVVDHRQQQPETVKVTPKPKVSFSFFNSIDYFDSMINIHLLFVCVPCCHR